MGWLGIVLGMVVLRLELLVVEVVDDCTGSVEDLAVVAAAVGDSIVVAVAAVVVFCCPVVCCALH